MKRVLCLYRVSTIGQVDHDDIPMQRIACREFIAQHPDWKLTEEISEKGVSGYKTKTEDRDALVQIKEKALAKTFDILLVFMFDRIGRRSKSSERIGNLRSTSDGLLTGLLFCGSCGERLCFNHNTTVRTLADGTRRVYERDVYRCYRKVNSRSTCQGQSTYAAQRIEKDVLAVVHGYFENIRTRPTAQMLSVAGERTRRIQEEALKQAEAALKKAQTEMTALEEAAVKALTGEGSMDLQFINSLIPKRKANLENALGEVERLRRELAEIEKAEQAASRELEMILSWAETFDAASRETQRSIIAMLIDRIVVYSDYRLDIHFRITVQQYLGKAS